MAKSKSKFDQAFAKARLDKQSVFDYEGDEKHKKGSYTTALASEGKSTSRAPAPKPAARSAAPKPSKSESSSSPKPGFTSAGKGVMRSRPEEDNSRAAMRARHESNVARERQLLADRKQEKEEVAKLDAKPYNPSKDLIPVGIKDRFGTGVQRGLRKLGAPDHVAAAVGAVTGRRRTMNNQDVTEGTIEQLRASANSARRFAGRRRPGASDKEAEVDKKNKENLRKGFAAVQYPDTKTDRAAVRSSFTRMLSPDIAAGATLGRYRAEYDKNGKPIRAKDTYGMSNPNSAESMGRYAEVGENARKLAGGRFNPIGSRVASGAAKLGLMGVDAVKDIARVGKPSRSDPKRNAGWGDVLENAGAHFFQAFGPAKDEEIPVSINLKEKAKGGAIKGYAKGGMVRGDGCASKGKTKGRFI